MHVTLVPGVRMDGPSILRGLPMTFINMLKDESGASAAEYALILAIIGTGIALASIGLGNAISQAMNEASTCIKTPTTSVVTAGC
jgi:pilus assembly protein Flp/PilA